MTKMVILGSLLSCGGKSSTEGCLDPDLDQWCSGIPAYEDSSGCGEPTGDKSFRCGKYDVVVEGEGSSGAAHYFDHVTGEHVATEFWRDFVADDWCGGLKYWYGVRIECDPECTYDGSSPDLPPCK